MNEVLRTMRVCLLLTTVLGCANTQSSTELLAGTRELPAPEEVVRPMRARLEEFGRMARAYNGQPGDFIIEVEILGNDTGITKELPKDLWMYACQVVGDMGDPFRTTRTYSTAVNLDAPGAIGLASLPQSVPPAPRLKLRGSLMRVFERVVTGREARANGLIRIGSGDADLEIGADEKVTLTTVRLSLMLVTPEGLSMPGPAASFEVVLAKRERSAHLSAFFAGNGAGVAGTLQASNDAGDAILDATGACMIQLLGQAMLLPYWRIDTHFEVNKQVETRLRTLLTLAGRSAVEATLKRLSLAAGQKLDIATGTVVTADREVMRSAMSRAGLDFTNINDLIEYTVRVWRTADYNTNVGRVESAITARAQAANEKASEESATIQAAAERTASALKSTDQRPVVFGYPAGTPMILFDLHLASDAQFRTVLSVVTTVPGCEEVKVDEGKRLLGVKFYGDPVDVQLALRGAPELVALDYSWSDGLRTIFAIPRP